MAKKMLIDATHTEETRVVVVDGTKVEEFDFETVNKRQLAGNIYLAKVTRVEPSLQAAFVDYGGNRHGFLAFAEIHPDYYQIPAADREALMAEERAYAEEQEAEENARGRKPRRKAAAEAAAPGDETASADPAEAEGQGGAEGQGDAPAEASDRDETIESVAEEDVAEEIRAPRKPRARRYKIQEVVKVRQIMLVQVVKEERGNKGAALTTYLSLAGRYCVLMPNTARGGGISRKITNIADRKKLKDIAGELDVPKGAGLIIRTAGSQRTRTEIKRDYEYLLRLWEQIRDLTFKSVAPAAIYEEGDLIKRTIRDLYSKEIDEVLVEGERGYRTAKDFMKMIMPSHAKNVKHYGDQMPLFARFQVESYLSAMFNPVVQLKSGGYIVIGVTEALVAIDVNSGRATKEGSIEETALKTNLEAAEEVARQLRLRDLAGLIVIDFIDMDERKNNAAVEKRMKDKLKSDRARIQIGRISGFGLMEMSRQRLRPGMLESTTQPCAHCHGTGLIRSDDSLALTILRAIEEEGTRKRSREVLVRAPVAVANFLINAKREHVAGIELRYGMSVRVEADPSLISPDFAIEKFKTATRTVPDATHAALSVDAQLMAQIDDEDDFVEDEPEDGEDIAAAPAEAPRAEAEARTEARTEAGEDEDEGGRSRRRRRRRRRKPGDRSDDQAGDGQTGDGQTGEDQSGEDRAAADQAVADQEGEAAGDDAAATADAVADAAASAEAPALAADDAAREAGPRRSRSRRRGGARAERGDAASLPEVVDLRDDASETRAEALPGVNAAAPAADPAPEAAAAEAAAPEAAAAEAAAGSDPADSATLSLADDAAKAAPEEPATPDQTASDQTASGQTAPDEAAPDQPAHEQTAREQTADRQTADDQTASDDATEAAQREPQLAEADSDTRPKRRGWWSLGR
ncbi:Rne/Rng family ribonuclease [Paracoccus spongiarum]|uniref:Ribonuclease E n=1 Tax=Paracoccus spongiarum TaxID=3064387 RepID=A0ABT9J7E6_9RHOB|nr:ribonuclease E/G [Paracoccus sp. 2205BS29-5]MDP5305554.1 ribonuclease E/G [Paracoccus sp. 2205BS29-5]